MYSLIYVSSAVQLMAGEELTQLLLQSRAKNVRLEITGLLLYKDGDFMQALEGAEDRVKLLFETIQRDSRPPHSATLERQR